jgi:hypothetical protein
VGPLQRFVGGESSIGGSRQPVENIVRVGLNYKFW